MSNSIRKIYTIFKKQMKDTFKNKTILVQIVMFPLMAFIMTNSVNIKDVPRTYFVLLFSSMYIGMAPIISVATIISEEKEKSTLKALLMSNVKAYEYLLGIGVYMWVVCMFGSVAFAVIGEFAGNEFMLFLSIMSIGIILSITIGAIIGIICKNQMMSTSVTVPFMMIFSFVPMLSMFNKTIEKISQFIYTQQIYNLISELNKLQIEKENIIVLTLTGIIVFVMFIVAYRRGKLVQ